MSNHVADGVKNGNGIGNLKILDEFFDLKKMPHIMKPLDRRQKIESDVLDGIGNTLTVRLNKIPKEEGVECDVFVKCEYLNPGGSVKDRIAYRMVIEAEKEGKLIPGKSVIIEPTSGNTGIGLALAAAVKGYRCIIVLPEKMSDEKVNTLLALGAEIIRTPSDVPSSDPKSNINVAKHLTETIENAVMLDQYNNPRNPLAHYDTTAEEILWSMDEDLDMVAIGAGTSGTVSGVGHKLKERCPKCKVVGIDPYGSDLAPGSDNNHEYYEVEGLGYDFLPDVLDRKVVDYWVKTDDKDSFVMARRLIKEEGILCGGSSGAAVWGAIQAIKKLGIGKGKKVLVLLPDSIRNYLTKFVSDAWMEVRAFKDLIELPKIKWWHKRLTRDLIRETDSVGTSTSVKEALNKLRKSGAPLLNVVDDNGLLVGVVTADDARRRFAYGLKEDDRMELKLFTTKKFYKVDLSKNPTLGLVNRMLDISRYVVVVDSSTSGIVKPVGVVTSDDLILHIADQQL